MHSKIQPADSKSRQPLLNPQPPPHTDGREQHLNAQHPGTAQGQHNTDAEHRPIEPANTSRQGDDPQPPPEVSHDPYLGFGVLGIGMTGVVVDIAEGRVVKEAKQSQLPDRRDAEYMMR
ncbi:hypothetical protein HK57_00645 [Aspergillus ustus]|uniref:Uncharacterized protein n=1 Tax=Aspergillus ustus TaxID=40382 RepID=A0A0C1BVL9_ASPUT|nr:hypothetical protein HK57_00645 [Aspergillus ustus]